jgi:predicted permease
VTQLLPILLAAAAIPGVLVGRRIDGGPLARQIWRVIYWTGLPLVPLVLAAAPIGAAGGAVLAATGCLLVVVAVSLVYARLRFAGRPERAAFALSAFWPNTGWLGIPVCACMLGPRAVPAAVLYASVASAPHNFVVGGSLAASHGSSGGGALAAAVRRNHYLLPTLLGVVWALSGVPYPVGLAHAASLFVVATAVPAFFALGLTLARVPLRPDRDLWAALSLRLGLSPLLLLGASAFVAVPRAFLVQAAMATGLNTLTLAGEHGLPMRRVAPAVAWSTGLVLAGATAWLLAT